METHLCKWLHEGSNTSISLMFSLRAKNKGNILAKRMVKMFERLDYFQSTLYIVFPKYVSSSLHSTIDPCK